MSSKKCPNCGNIKKPWFPLCWECQEKENQKPTCDVCDIEVPEGHNLCKEHWKEKQNASKNIKKAEYIKNKQEQNFKEKFEGKFYFNSQKVKSKSELLICYFLTANNVQFMYEPIMTPNGKEIRPDFVLDDGKGNLIILEHFGLDDRDYLNKKNQKIKDYEKLCKENKEFSFIYTNEEDIYNLKDKLGQKLNKTPLNRVIWK